nr:hypothetical protein [Nonomuraea sp. C10]
MGLDAAVGERGDHLGSQRRRLVDDRGLHRVEDLVPLHRLADVLDVVDAAQVAVRHVRVGVVEAGGEHERVVAFDGAVGRGHRLGLDVDARDGRLVADVDALVDVLLLGRHEQRLEARDLAAVDVGNPAGAVRSVLVSGEDDDLRARVRALGGTRGTHPSGSTAYNNDSPGHLPLVSHRNAPR